MSYEYHGGKSKISWPLDTQKDQQKLQAIAKIGVNVLHLTPSLREAKGLIESEGIVKNKKAQNGVIKPSPQ